MTNPEPINQTVTTNTEPAVLGPLQRWYRTIFQVVIAVLVATPAAVALLDLSKETVAKITGFTGAALILVSAVHNAINAKQADPLAWPAQAPPTDDEGRLDLSIVVDVIIIIILVGLAVLVWREF